MGKIVEVMHGPYERRDSGDAEPSYDVRYQGWIFYCHAHKLLPINDPDADVGEERDDTLAK